MGGRGAVARAKGNMRRLAFNSGPGGASSPELLPARVNRTSDTGDTARLVKGFAREHARMDHEYAITIDEYGYATHYFEGKAGSVTPSVESLSNAHLSHNHPHDGWANFSGQDLDAFAATKVRAMSAVSQNVLPGPGSSERTKSNYANRRAGIYSIEKTQHFKVNEFRAALRKIRVQDNKYDIDLHKWLVKNQKVYGYKYSYTKAKNKPV